MVDKLPRFRLVFLKDRWQLVNFNGTIAKAFGSKRSALRGGVLEAAIGRGHVSIYRKDGKLQEQRCYPRTSDPRGKE